ncbi:FK506-binding protein 2B [Mucor mucedo]|uniref:FK506-binding protein 2B n=1 Tax=Mucor mucedo TaxID=29922 RepID=UPI0022205B4E|nr:FK506-binding protein 2B [Mucor mucedo]KAI7889270.1 FK506-binding protein 2B [Mucor mucedo]
MRITAGLAFIVTAVTSVMALKEAPADLQIGILKRVPAEKCLVRSNNGDQLSMHYTGTLFDTGVKFDSSLDRNDPFVFEIGKGQVIGGWEQGLLNMCIGEKRKLTIPPHLGYGDRGSYPVIPGGATLVFEVELLDIKKGQRNERKGPETVKTNDDEAIISFSSPSFILSTAGILILFFLVFRMAKKQDIVEAKKAVEKEIKEKK